MSFNLKGIGDVEIKKGKIKVNSFNMSSDEFVNKYRKYTEYLNTNDLNAVKDAIDQTGKEKKVKSEEDVIAMFANIEKEALLSKSKGGATTPAPKRDDGFGADEKAEAKQAEEMKKKTYDSGKVETKDGQPTKNSKGEVTGRIELLGDTNQEGLVVKTRIEESAIIKYDFNSETPMKEFVEPLKGKVVIENPSKKDKMTAIRMTLDKAEKTDLKETEILEKQLPPEQTITREYQIVGEAEPSLKVTEFVSTIDDEKVVSYALANGKENVIYVRTEVENTSDKELLDIILLKEVHKAFENPTIERVELGDAKYEVGENIYFVNMPEPAATVSPEKSNEEENIKKPPEENKEDDGDDYKGGDEYNAYDDSDKENGKAADDIKGAIVWKIEKLAPNQKVSMVYRIKINVTDKSVSVRTGRVKINYKMNSSISGLGIDIFEAVSNERMGISVEQDETEPNKYHCDVIFRNLSEFTVKLVNCDVYDSENLDVKYVDLDPADDVYLPGGAEWHSEVFDVESESEQGPEFKEEVKCFLIRSEEVTATSKIQVNDVKLAVASLTGTIAFDRSEIPSYVQVEVQATLTSENDGGAPFNELVMEQFVINGFLPPQADQIKLTFNNDEVPVDPSWLEVVDHTDEETNTPGKLIRIKVEDIKEKLGKFYEPGDKFVAVYPIIADKIEKDVNFHAYAKYIGETYPKGLPIEYMVEEKFEIRTVHERRKISKYKDVNSLEKEGEWEIVLTRENRGNSTIKDLKIKDLVPAGFTHGKYSMKKPNIEDMEGGNMLVWTVDALEPGKEVKITYLITGEAADYDPKKLSVQY